MARSSQKIVADTSLAQARKNSAYFKRLLRAADSSHHSGTSIRETHHNGHHITIKTTYEVRVDGKVFDGALLVANSGDVHYHAIPTVGFPSAVDLMKCVIDVFPDDFRSPSHKSGEHHASEHGGHRQKSAAKKGG